MGFRDYNPYDYGEYLLSKRGRYHYNSDTRTPERKAEDDKIAIEKAEAKRMRRSLRLSKMVRNGQ